MSSTPRTCIAPLGSPAVFNLEGVSVVPDQSNSVVGDQSRATLVLENSWGKAVTKTGFEYFVFFPGLKMAAKFNDWVGICKKKFCIFGRQLKNKNKNLICRKESSLLFVWLLRWARPPGRQCGPGQCGSGVPNLQDGGVKIGSWAILSPCVREWHSTSDVKNM